jgi:hypothetical protein
MRVVVVILDLKIASSHFRTSSFSNFVSQCDVFLERCQNFLQMPLSIRRVHCYGLVPSVRFFKCQWVASLMIRYSSLWFYFLWRWVAVLTFWSKFATLSIFLLISNTCIIYFNLEILINLIHPFQSPIAFGSVEAKFQDRKITFSLTHKWTADNAWNCSV